jgi:hypothetical protein
MLINTMHGTMNIKPDYQVVHISTHSVTHVLKLKKQFSNDCVL